MADVGAAERKAEEELRDHDYPCNGNHFGPPRFAPGEPEGKHQQNGDNHQ